MSTRKFKALAQATRASNRPTWGTRWNGSENSLELEVEAHDLHVAAFLAEQKAKTEHPNKPWRIVSVEEMRKPLMPPQDNIDQAILNAFVDEFANPDLYPEIFKNPLYHDYSVEEFCELIEKVAIALDSEDLAPGISIQIMRDPDGIIHGSEVQVWQGDRKRYLGQFEEIEHLTTNPDAMGLEGLQAIATALLQSYLELS